MKYFDSRSLAVLEQALSDEQRMKFFAVAREWWFLERGLQLRRIRGGSGDVDPYRTPLRLSEQQAKAFIDASLPDSVLHTLGKTDSDLLAEFDLRTRYEICERSLVDASEDERNSAVLLAKRARTALMMALAESNREVL